MTREEFKTRWEKDTSGGGITWEDISKCYVEWGLGQRPKTQKMETVGNQVLGAAGIAPYFDVDEDVEE